MKKLKNILFIITHPGYWWMNYEYSPKWDEKLNYLLGEGPFTDIESHTAKLGGVEIWISNHPYASFIKYGAFKVRPSRMTIKRAREKLLEDAESSI